MIEFDVGGIEIGDNPIGEEQRGAQMSVYAIGKQGMAKKRHPPTDENGKKHQNRHEMVIHGSKSDVDPTKMIRKTRSTKIRSSYCAKTLKMRV